VRRLALLLTLLGSFISCGDSKTDGPDPAVTMTAAPAGATSGQIWQQQCGVCHGGAGEGNRALDAPALTQLSSDYLARQLTHFVNGVRGADPKDQAGHRMALSVALLAPSDIPALAAFISTDLPPARPEATLKGEATRGKDYYTHLCSACHGGNALGNPILGAPSLAGASDWYLKSAYQGFLDGLRGQHVNDVYGAQMARLAPALSDENDLDDVIAHIMTLPPKRS
jgi:cytochrome c oxidase subunit 2